MSNPATFWAAKSTDVKSSQSPTQVMEPTPARITAVQDGMVLNSATNGFKKNNWADSDDEEDFLKSFTLSGRVKELEAIVSAKDSRITDLATAAKDKDARISELEFTLDAHKQRLADLQSVVDASVIDSAKLKEDNHKQVFHAQNLVAEAVEEQRRLAALETEVDKHRTPIIESDASDGATQISSHAAMPAKKTHVQTAATPVKIIVQREAAETIQQIHSTSQTTVEAAPNDTSTPVISSPKAISTKAAGPAVNLSAFPVFATPATVKQTTPPPPAPKLKMAVDLSKFTKKPTSKTAMPKKKIYITANEVTKDGPAPKIDPSLDIRTKQREERALFANGPHVQVKMGDDELATLPKYILMQCSHKAFKYFSEHPDSTSFILPAESMDEAAAKAHLSWMKEMTYQGRVYSITLHSDEKFDDKNLQICRAARVLGLNNMYVGHFTKIFCDRIRSNTASYEFQDKIAASAYPDNDPLFDCLANNLASLRTRSAIKEPTELEALLNKHATLKTRVEKIEERMLKLRGGARIAMGLKVVQVGKSL